MYEELCWINTLIQQGTFNPNWGSRYFAELVNPIPRRFWPGKPLIGIDYAMARGQGGGEASEAGVYATISTGMIGQGVVNFGRVLGPAFAALLMSFWVAILARLDLHIQELGRLPLFATGLFTTFNMGRDVGFIALYPFVFGMMMVGWLDYYRARQPHLASYGARPQGPLFALKTKSVKMWRLNKKVMETGGRVSRTRNARSPAKWRETRSRIFPQSP
jgi:hypothetical protein